MICGNGALIDMGKSGAMAEILQKNMERLGRLLITGNEEFIVAVHQWGEHCSRFPEADRQSIYLETVKYLRDVYDEEFPWMKTIEMAEVPEENMSRSAMDQWAKTTFSTVEKYDLLKNDSLFRSLCALVYHHIEDGISLRMIADMLGISADYAGRIFKRRTNIHFATFVMETKMERGKELLLNTRLKNYEISTRLGYSNPDYFRQLFKAYTGITPTEYRNIHRYGIYR